MGLGNGTSALVAHWAIYASAKTQLKNLMLGARSRVTMLHTRILILKCIHTEFSWDAVRPSRFVSLHVTERLTDLHLVNFFVQASCRFDLLLTGQQE
jgi:hypothetical protein